MPRFLQTLGLFFLFAATAQPATRMYGPYEAEVVRVIDGDTVELSVQVWPGLTQVINLRLDGVNTPEKRGKGVSECEKKAAQDATTFTQRWLKDAPSVTVYDIHLGKYAGRALGKLRKGNRDLGSELVKSGHAKPYDGGTRQPWC